MSGDFYVFTKLLCDNNSYIQHNFEALSKTIKINNNFKM